ncbi:MAG: NAD(P)/FAD-dependent oxidoreductase [Solirubrobacteraceae bacterium]
MRNHPSKAIATFPRRSLTPTNAVRGLWFDDAMASEPAGSACHRLSGSIAADVCIVGGGFVGLWTALEIKRRRPGADVVVVEADVCGGGASGRNGGFAMTWWSKFGSLVKMCGIAEALALARRAEQAVREIGAFCADHDIDAEYRACGWVWAATNIEQADAWMTTLDALAAAEVTPYERLNRREVAERTGSPVHLGGVFEPTVATVQPAKLARGLTHAAQAEGIKIFERTAVTELRAGEPAQLVTDQGEVRASVVVLAMNAWASRIPQVGRGLVVVSSDVVATAPIPGELEAIGWRHGPAVSDSRRLVNYYRTSEDGRLVFGKGGGGVAVSGRLGPEFHVPSPRRDEVAAQMRFVYPMLWQVPIDHAWRGPIDYSVTGLPFFCRLDDAPNVIVAAGFSGNGVGPAKLAGEVLAEMAVDGGDAGLPLALTRAPAPRMPPEPVRYVGARFVRGALARKEAREDVGGRVDRVTAFLASLDPTSFVDRGDSTPASTPGPGGRGHARTLTGDTVAGAVNGADKGDGRAATGSEFVGRADGEPADISH